ncbi:MAG: sensor histidine kinase [Streptosporangiaceae bacterium]
MTSARSPSGASWPGKLVERALGLVTADYRRPVGPVVVATVLAVWAGFSAGRAAGPLPPDLAVVLGVAGTAPLAVIRRYPGVAVFLVLTANAVFIMFGRLSWSVAAVIGWLAALAACPLVLARRPAAVALVLTEAVALLGSAGLGGNVSPWDASIAEALAALAAWGAGELLLARRTSAAERAQNAERVRHLRERDAAASERASIARELHDVVAHHVSMIAVRAATAPYAVSGLSEPGQAAFAEIADEARAALTELRVALGVLRSPDGQDPEAAPQPRIADLAELVEKMTGAAMTVTLTVSGRPRRLAGSVELCCYRVVQEALTNAQRHAPAAPVAVEIGYGADAVSVKIANGSGSGGREREETGPGYGLTGLRERVSLLRGEFQAGQDERGGFEVIALLPAPGPGDPVLAAGAPGRAAGEPA